LTPLTEHPGYPEDPASPDSPAPAIRIVVADDETLIREALEAILSLQADIDVVAVAASGTEAIVQIERHRPDVAVLDLLMPGADGIEVAAAVARLIISMLTVPSDTARLSASVAASASLTPSLKVLTRAAHSLKPPLIPAVPMLPKGVRVFIASPIARICSRVILR